MSRRLRITYSHSLDCTVQPGALARAWVEAFESAGMPLERPEGSKRPRVESGPALPVGASGEREIFDAWLAGGIPDADEVCQRLASCAPGGLVPLQAAEIGERLPSLSSSLRSATYRVEFAQASVNALELGRRVTAVLEQATLEVDEARGERVRRIDLRGLILALSVAPTGHGGVGLEMHLVAEQERTGRPATVLAALGCSDAAHSIVRTSIEVDVPRVALRAWRARGRFG